MTSQVLYEKRELTNWQKEGFGNPHISIFSSSKWVVVLVNGLFLDE